MDAKKCFKDISPRAWEHPADRAALNALKQLPFLDDIIKKVIGLTDEKAYRLIALSCAVRVSEKQFPKIYRMNREASEILDINPVPEIYVSQNPFLNASAIGVDNPFVMLNSSMLKSLDDTELLCVVGHELGHIKSGHALYKTLLAILVQLSATLLAGIPQLALLAIILALREWDRKSELSADRAGLLVIQELNPSIAVLMKLAGGSDIGQMNLEEFFRQADEYESGGDLLDSVYKILNLLRQTHPFPVIRVKELQTWHASGAYQAILDGKYTKAGGEKVDPFADIKDAGDNFREEMKRSKDPLTKIVNDLGGKLDEAGKNIGNDVNNLFRSIFGGK
ncbi:MAG: M48 family metallopeptidase [Spirochaetales bacterium]|nr:M48 family metallopeptidase [Spirochaetales bacterium]